MYCIKFTKMVVLLFSLATLFACEPSTDPVVGDPTGSPQNNSAPNGSISHDNGTTTAGSTGNIAILTGTTVVFNGSATDPEGDPVSYAWSFTTGTTPTTATVAGPISIVYSTAGSFTVQLTVSDNKGLADPTPATVSVTVTDPPVVVNSAPNGSISHNVGTGSAGTIAISTGATVVFNSSATDPEGDPVSYAWSFTTGTTPTTATGPGPISVVYSTAGSFTVQLTVSDNKGLADPSPAIVNVTVSAPPPPVAALPPFQYLPVLSDTEGNPDNGVATYALSVDANVPVKVNTPNESWTTPMMRYNSLQLPPVIVAKRDTQITVKVTNKLAEDTTVHWHGFKLPADQDGGPNFPIAANGVRTYQFTLAQAAAPLWFHPHAHGTTATQVYKGLAGAFIVTDDISDELETSKQIPSGAQDIAMMIQDRTFTAANAAGVRTLVYNANSMMNMGMLGDRILVNGVQMPSLKVSKRQYRFRLFNGSNARTYDIALRDGANFTNVVDFTVVGTDGGLLNAPVTTDHIMLGAGERSEIVVNFADYAVNASVRLVSRLFTDGGGMGGGPLPNGAPFDIMQFDIDNTAVTDDVTLYSSLPTGADIKTRLIAEDASKSRDFIMSETAGAGMGPPQFRINNKLFDINRVDEIVGSGAVEIWNISNTSAMAHPFHAHAIQWQVLDRNEIPSLGTDLGWKDTVLVQPNESVRIMGRFDPVINKGTYMYHCHILEHEEAGMMGTFEVK